MTADDKRALAWLIEGRRRRRGRPREPLHSHTGRLKTAVDMARRFKENNGLTAKEATDTAIYFLSWAGKDLSNRAGEILQAIERGRTK